MCSPLNVCVRLFCLSFSIAQFLVPLSACRCVPLVKSVTLSIVSQKTNESVRFSCERASGSSVALLMAQLLLFICSSVFPLVSGMERRTARVSGHAVVLAALRDMPRTGLSADPGASAVVIGSRALAHWLLPGARGPPRDWDAVLPVEAAQHWLEAVGPGMFPTVELTVHTAWTAAAPTAVESSSLPQTDGKEAGAEVAIRSAKESKGAAQKAFSRVVLSGTCRDASSAAGEGDGGADGGFEFDVTFALLHSLPAGDVSALLTCCPLRLCPRSSVWRAARRVVCRSNCWRVCWIGTR
jgi:hypothetical protein